MALLLSLLLACGSAPTLAGIQYPYVVVAPSVGALRVEVGGPENSPGFDDQCTEIPGLVVEIDGVAAQRVASTYETGLNHRMGPSTASCIGPAWSAPIDTSVPKHRVVVRDATATWALETSYLAYTRNFSVESVGPGSVVLKGNPGVGEVVRRPAWASVTATDLTVTPCIGLDADAALAGDTVTLSIGIPPQCGAMVARLTFPDLDPLAIMGCPPGGNCFLSSGAPSQDLEIPLPPPAPPTATP